MQPIELESLEEILKANRNYRSCLTPGKPLIHIRPKLQRETGLVVKRRDFASRKGGLSSTGFRTASYPNRNVPASYRVSYRFRVRSGGEEKNPYFSAPG